MLHFARLAMKHHHAAAVAEGVGMLGYEFLGQLKLKLG